MQGPTVYLLSGGGSFPREDVPLVSSLRITADEDEADSEVESCLTGTSLILYSSDVC